MFYEYEKDCNSKVIGMLESVPEASRGAEPFKKAMGKATHVIAARHMWLFRLGLSSDKPGDWFPEMSLEQLRSYTADIEKRWTAYLSSLTEDAIVGPVEWVGYDGKRRRWTLLDLLTQIFGHAWYHRGQVAMLVKQAGGTPVDCDYIFWNKPTVLE